LKKFAFALLILQLLKQKVCFFKISKALILAFFSDFIVNLIFKISQNVVLPQFKKCFENKRIFSKVNYVSKPTISFLQVSYKIEGIL
jgi:hypothetical protein